MRLLVKLASAAFEFEREKFYHSVIPHQQGWRATCSTGLLGDAALVQAITVPYCHREALGEEVCNVRLAHLPNPRPSQPGISRTSFSNFKALNSALNLRLRDLDHQRGVGCGVYSSVQGTPPIQYYYRSQLYAFLALVLTIDQIERLLLPPRPEKVGHNRTTNFCYILRARWYLDRTSFSR